MNVNAPESNFNFLPDALPSLPAMDRKDALTKKPLDFDQEEETRKVETSKWLENHFGSESRSSKDSIGEDDDERPPKTSFFNVTIKSQPSKADSSPPPPVQPAGTSYTSRPIRTASPRMFNRHEPERERESNRMGYFQGNSKCFLRSGVE